MLVQGRWLGACHLRGQHQVYVSGGSVYLYQGITAKRYVSVNHRNEIKKMASRVPDKVKDGSLQQAIEWKKIQEKAMTIARKVRASELELLEAYSQLKQYE